MVTHLMKSVATSYSFFFLIYGNQMILKLYQNYNRKGITLTMHTARTLRVVSC